MKKILSVLISAVLIFSLFSVAFAENEVTPIIIVSGMGSSIYEKNDSGETETVFPPSAQSITNAVTSLVPALSKAMVTNDYSGIKDSMKPIKDMFYNYSCDTYGNLNGDVFTDFKDTNMVGRELSFEMAEFDIAQDFSDKIGGENVYFFNYIWSLSPVKIAEDLNNLINKVLEEKNCDKVSLVACSMGGTITMSYLAKYGNEHIKNVLLVSTAFQGVELVGQLFTEQIDINVTDLLRYFSDYTGYDFVQPFVTALEKGLKSSGNLISKTDLFISDLIENIKADVFSDVFIETYVAMPGMWALMPNAYYEEAKEVLFTDKEKYKFLEEIDWYMEEVQSKASELINEWRSTGTDIYIVATYLTSGMPLIKDNDLPTDNLIDLKYASGGATVAPLWDEIKEQSNTVCTEYSHNHISADKIIDASSCILPEQTWFIKNVSHMGYEKGTSLTEILLYLASSESEVNIYSNEKYPQFTDYNKITKELTPNKEVLRVSCDDEWSVILKDFATKLFEFIKLLLSSYLPI